MILRFAERRPRKGRPPQEEIVRLCAKIQKYLNKRFGEDAGTCSPMECESPNAPDIYFRAWRGAPQELLYYAQAEEVLEALMNLW